MLISCTRFLTFTLDSNWAFRACKLKPSFMCLALWRTWLYSIVTSLRLYEFFHVLGGEEFYHLFQMLCAYCNELSYRVSLFVVSLVFLFF